MPLHSEEEDLKTRAIGGESQGIVAGRRNRRVVQGRGEGRKSSSKGYFDVEWQSPVRHRLLRLFKLYCKGDKFTISRNCLVPLTVRERDAKETLGLAIWRQVLKVGEDWIFLFLLGMSMATISFSLDVIISKFQRANLWVYDSLDRYRYLQYFSWALYHVFLTMVSAGVAKYLSPQAAGSGIPELKVTLRGVTLDEFFTFRTFLAKLIGVTCTLAAGSTIFLGKVNKGRKYEMLIAGAAVGVACCFVAPVGGVLFSVETTATHFAVRNYWRGFFAATCAALMFRLLAVVNNEHETVAVLFSTNWRVEFPFDLPEFLSFALLGVICGCLCCLYLFCHRNLTMFLTNHGKISKFMANNKILFAGFVALVLASVTYPHGVGQYIGSRLSMKEHLETFFDNRTWGSDEQVLRNSTCQPPFPTYDEKWLQWTHPRLSSLEMLAFFIIVKFFMLLLATTMVVPAGYFLPVFVYGAGLGRLYGEIMAKIFPEGIISEGIRIKITPSGYALAGAAAYSGAVTHTISTALLVFELTGQMSHILPVLFAVLVANAISQRSQPSFFDGIVIVKKLPYLPKLTVGKSGAHNIYVEDFMETDLRYVAKDQKYKDVRNLLKNSKQKQFPLVDSTESKVLLGSINRKNLAKLLARQLNPERRLQFRQEQQRHAKETLAEGEVTPGSKSNTSDGAQTSETQPSNRDDNRYFENEETKMEQESWLSKAGGKKRFRCYTVDGEEVVDTMTTSEVEEWEYHQFQEVLRLDECVIDPAPFRLVKKETLHECYDLFNLLGLRIAYVTSTGRLVGVVALKELKAAVERCVKGMPASESLSNEGGPPQKVTLIQNENA
ncbi:chloride channel protein ClC-Kb-like isoform X3 [Narcine bancroftii]|uniref:chloride channel protein ClC-Kb-like isoform X3 n=1 Tax=Narcine bancroftii TaxID=1343680 RepID=UPI0038318BBC